ncbi:MAG: hypothetical protein GF335_02940, partial [Candidatus Moranbacteria bacterium]|nr:hypothetical protein [Candidatus Moranbacteria bacterium]
MANKKIKAAIKKTALTRPKKANKPLLAKVNIFSQNSAKKRPGRKPQGFFTKFIKKIRNKSRSRVKKSKKIAISAINTLDVLTVVNIHILVFLIPVFFLPFTNSPLEFNKLLVLFFFSFLSIFSWLAKSFIQAELSLHRHYFLYPIGVFLIFLIVSVYYSIYQENSLWGYPGTEGSSLLAWICYFLVFIIIVNKFNQNNKHILFLLLNLLISSLFIFLLIILQLSNLITVEKIQFDAIFNPIGNLYDLAVYYCALLIIALTLYIEKNQILAIRALSLLTIIISFVVIAMVNYNLLWLVLFFTLIFLVFKKLIKDKGKNVKPLSIPISILFISIISFFVFKNQSVVAYPAEKSNINEISPTWSSTWTVAANSIKDKPLIGVGLNNYYYLFSKYKKPISSDLDNDFYQAKSYFFTLLSENGVLLTISFLMLIVVFMTWFTQQTLKDKTKLFDPIFNLWFFIGFVLFFHPASLPLLFLWWLSAGMLVAIKKPLKNNFLKDNYQKKVLFFRLLTLSLLIITFGFFVYSSYQLTKKYLASNFFAKALYQFDHLDQDQPNYDKIQTNINKAIGYNPYRANYYLLKSEIHWLQAIEKVEQNSNQNLTDQGLNQIKKSISESIQSVKTAIRLNQYNYRSYLKLAYLYQNFAAFNKDNLIKAKDNFEKAKQYNPNDPTIYNQLAKIYLNLYDQEIFDLGRKNQGVVELVPLSAQEKIKLAQRYLTKALELDSSNITSNMLLASSYEIQGNLEQAIKVIKNIAIEHRSDSKIQLSLALLYYKTQKYDLAIDYLRPLVERWDDYSDARY